MNILTRTALGTLTASAAFLAAGAGTASAAATTACPDGISPAFSKVQLFNGANCGGGSMIVRNDDASPNRPNFAKFRNYDGKVYDVQNNRSSLTVAKGTCVRLYDGANYTGASSPNICATAGTVEWNLTELDNRASSMRVTAAGAPTPSPTPTPTPTPTPAPSAGGFPVDVKSAPDTSKYDDAGPYNKGKGCTKGFTPGAKKLQAWLRANFGAATIQGFSCRPNTASTSKTSIHGVGRASDWFNSVNKASDRKRVASFIKRMTANGAAQARAMGVQYFIWNRKQYSVRGTKILVRSYGGPNPHTDHVHIEQNIAGSKLQTSYWKLAGR